MINCSIGLIGTRWFICIGHGVFPVDRISYIDTAALDCDDPKNYALRIGLSDPDDELVWTETSDAEDIRKFLRGFNLNVASDDGMRDGP